MRSRSVWSVPFVADKVNAISKTAEKQYDELLSYAKDDKDVLGFILLGSRGKGIVTKNSDYDIDIIIRNGAKRKFNKNHFLSRGFEGFDIRIKTLDEFEKYARFGSEYEWDRYNYARVKVQIDKNNKIQKLVDEKGGMPLNEKNLHKYIYGTLDAYVNYVYRSMKCMRDGDALASRLNAAKELPYFMNALFALDHRIAPYYKYLEWELGEYPIRKFAMDKHLILKSIRGILDGDIYSQQKLLKATEKTFRENGYDGVFDSWEKKLEWMKSAVLK